jgi:hypothetical protein
MKSVTVAYAESKCRAAWAAAPDAKFAWCCHHSVELEVLADSAVNRMYYIRIYKPYNEQSARLDNFRPVLSELPAEVMNAGLDFLEALASYRSRASFIDYDPALKHLRQVIGNLAPSELARMHDLDVPGHTWDRFCHSIFGYGND